MSAGDDIRNLSDEQLGFAARNTTEELFKLRFQHHTGQLQNSANLRATRRKLARIKTIQNERKLGIAASSGGN